MSPRVEVAVGAVIRRHDELLLIQRAHAPQAGRWSVPGGRVEPGEGLHAALRREVLEEVGIDVEIGSLVGVVERSGEGFHFVVADFEATCPDRADPSAGDDASEVAWVSLHELDRWDLVAGLRDFLVEHDVI